MPIMKQTQHLTAEQRALALLMRKELNYSYRKIASKTNMSKTSVERIVKQDDVRYKIVKKAKSYPGRRRALSERDERKLKRAIMQLRKRLQISQ